MFMLPAILLVLVLPLGGIAADGVLQPGLPSKTGMRELPPLDAAAPPVFETASFGLG